MYICHNRAEDHLCIESLHTYICICIYNICTRAHTHTYMCENIPYTCVVSLSMMVHGLRCVIKIILSLCMCICSMRINASILTYRPSVFHSISKASVHIRHKQTEAPEQSATCMYLFLCVYVCACVDLCKYV